MKNELISVIVPIYNVEKYLPRCLDSICNQTYQNLEIILVDDGSPDNCGNICDDYARKDSRIKVIHKENGGLSSARNAGIDVANGKYISFIDSDDYVSNYFIERLYSLCIENNCDISECSYAKFENDLILENTNSEIEIVTPNDMQLKLFSNNTGKTIVVWNKLYKKYIFENLRFPIGKINEDEFTTYKAFYFCKTNIAITDEELYYYRYNSQSIMGRKFNVKRLDALEAWKEQKEFYRERKEDDLLNKTIIKTQKRLQYYYVLTRENIENSKEYLKKIRIEFKNNLKEYLKLKEVSKIEKTKMMFFYYFPEMYYFVIKLVNKINWSS